MATLKSLQCGDYEVYVAERGSSSLLCRLRGLSDISYNRTLNEFSECRITVSANAECVSCLTSVNPWKHEVIVFRDGVRVWVGPIVNLKYQSSDSKIQVYARDLLAWTEKRFIEVQGEDYDVLETELSTVFEWVLSHGYDKEPWDMTWEISPTGIPIDRFYPGYYGTDRWGGAYPRVADELRTLSASGVDFTVVERHMYIGDLTINPPGDTLIVADHNWAKSPEINVDGAKMSTRTGVAGGSGGYYGWYDDQIWIEEDSASRTEYGLLETMHSQTGMDDEYTTELPNAITQEAYGRHQFLRQPQVFITGGQLAGDAPFEFGSLIPGVPIKCGIVSQFRDIDNDYRLYSIDVKVGPESEEISLELSLPGVEDLKTT